MPIKMGTLTRESANQAKFRIQLEAAVRSAVPGASVDPVALDAMVGMVRSKVISPGDALSCFKYYFREGSPDEQLQALLVLAQFVGSDPHLANLLHTELASRRWRERFLALAASPHPEVKPLLVSTLQGWSNSYRAHDIGMHYVTTLRELSAPSGPFRPGPSYQPQHTGYSTQTTGAGYALQHTGQAYPPPPGYPAPGGYPPLPGYPPYGAPVPYGAPPPHPPPPPPHHPPPPPRNDAVAMSAKIDQLSGEVESLRGACRAFESALADYKAQRCPFSALSAAMDRGQRAADKCAALQGQLENLVGSSEGGDEGLLARIFSTNDSAVAALEAWRKLADQDLAPDDTPAVVPSAAAAGPGPSTSAAAAPPPPPPRPAPSPLDLLLGDELPSPLSTPGQPQVPQPAAPAGAATGQSSGGAAANGMADQGASAWAGAPAGGAPAAPAPAPAAASGLEAAAAAAAAAGGGSGLGALGSGPQVVPASDMEGLRAQVLALAADLEKQRKVHATALEAQEAFHRSELAQVRAQSAARIAELEAALARQQLQPPQPAPSPLPSPLPSPAPAQVAGANQFSAFSPFGAAPAAPAAAPSVAYGISTLPYPAAVPAAPLPLPSGLPSNNPFAAFSFPAAPSPSPMASVTAPVAPPPLQVAAGPGGDAAKDPFSGFDELALGARKSAGGAPLPMRASLEKSAPAPAPMPSPAAVTPPPPPSAPGASAFGRPAAAQAAAVAAGADGNSWVNFGL